MNLFFIFILGIAVGAGAAALKTFRHSQECRNVFIGNTFPGKDFFSCRKRKYKEFQEFPVCLSEKGR